MKRSHVRTAICSLVCPFLLTAPTAANVPLRCVDSAALRTTTTADKTGGLAAALAVALDAVDPERKAILVAGAALSKAARRAAAAGGRRVIDMAHVPQSTDTTLPAGYLRIDSATLSSDEARVKLWRGPIPKAKPGVILMDCGTGLTFQLKRESDGSWTISSRGVAQC